MFSCNYKINKVIFAFACLVCVTPVFAVFGNASTGAGGVAVEMLEPVGLFSNFVHAACFILGTSFLFASVVKYFEHRRSPLMVPISTVVFLVIAGAVLLTIPLFSYFFNETYHLGL